MKVLGGCLVIGIFIFIVLVVIGVIIDAFNGENGGENGDTAKAGLGVSRDAVEDAFGDFDFEDAPLKDGRDRLMGDSPGESATLELIGEKDNLEEVALLMTVSSTGGNSEVLRTRGRSSRLYFLIGKVGLIGLKTVLLNWPTIAGRTLRLRQGTAMP